MPNPFDLDDHAVAIVNQLEKRIHGDMHHRVEILLAGYQFMVDSRHQNEMEVWVYPPLSAVLAYVRAYRPESFPDSIAR